MPPTSHRVIGRTRSSLLTKILAALFLNLAVASGLTAFATAHLTKSAVIAEACQRARSHLTIIERAYTEREQRLARNVRDMAMTFEGLVAPEKRNELIQQLGGAPPDYELDVLEVVEGDRPVASVGRKALDPHVTLPSSSPALPPSLLLPTTLGTYVQAVFIPIGTSDLMLVGGYEFADDFAFKLRAKIGDLDQVVLAAHGRVVGSTLHRAQVLPRPGPPQCQAGRSPTVTHIGNVETLIEYVPVGPSGGQGALGVALADPMAPLGKSLAQSRLASSVFLVLVALGLGWLLLRALTRPLMDLANTAGKIATGEFDVSFAPHSRHDEIGRLADALERMTSALRTQAAHLRESAKRTVAAQDAERHRLARDLHDGAQQRLVTLSLILRTAKARLRTDRTPELDEILGEAAQELKQAQSELRELARGIHPAILTDEGLGPALESLAQRSRVPARITAVPNDRLPAPVEATAYFIVSEALVNVAKYGQASLVTISVSQVNGDLRVEVADDGIGGADPTAGSGLSGLTDRATALGGWLEVESPRGQGTRLVAQVPCGQS